MTRTAVIAGVGPGLGASLARMFVEEGCQVGLFARSASYIEELAGELGDRALAVATDITENDEVEAGFEAVSEAFGPVDVLVNHASGGAWKGLREISGEEFEHALSVGPQGGLYCSQEAVADMLGTGGGTIIFTGATSAVRGRDGAVGFSAARRTGSCGASGLDLITPAACQASSSVSRSAASSAPATFGIRLWGGNGNRASPLFSRPSQTRSRSSCLSIPASCPPPAWSFAFRRATGPRANRRQYHSPVSSSFPPQDAQ